MGTAAGSGRCPAETARRLACDAAVTRVLVSHHPTGEGGHAHDPDQHPAPHDHDDATAGLPTHHHPAGGLAAHHDHGDDGTDPAGDLAARLRAAIRLLPPALGGAPTQPLEVGRATRVVSAAQRTALAVRDGGCRYPGCNRPPARCDAHHLRHWLHGGATDLANLVLLCRTHHRAVHEGGQHLHPPHRQPTAA